MEDSRMEERIHDILTFADVPFREEFTFPDLVASSGRPLRFDFAVFDDSGELDFLIEANGVQHYKPVTKFGGSSGLRRQRYNDSQKKSYCAKNNITLVTVPYWDEGKVSYEYIMQAAGHM